MSKIFSRLRGLQKWTDKRFFTWRVKILDCPSDGSSRVIASILFGSGFFWIVKYLLGKASNRISIVAKHNTQTFKIDIHLEVTRTGSKESHFIYEVSPGQRMQITLNVADSIGVQINNRMISFPNNLAKFESGYRVNSELEKNGWIIRVD